jgi:F0F1-type ATP synthase assembly protein I
MSKEVERRIVDYISGALVGYCIGMIIGVWIL